MGLRLDKRNINLHKCYRTLVDQGYLPKNHKLQPRLMVELDYWTARIVAEAYWEDTKKRTNAKSIDHKGLQKTPRRLALS